MQVSCVTPTTPVSAKSSFLHGFPHYKQFIRIHAPSRTLYQHYVRAVESNIVPVVRLIQRSFRKLRCTFVRSRGCYISKRFHEDSVTHSQLYCYTHTEEYCATKEETIARLCTEAMNGGEICAINPSSQLQTVCSASSDVSNSLHM